MDRTLKVFTKTEHLFAEFIFYYDHAKQANATYTQYRKLYDDNEEDELKSVYPLMKRDMYLNYQKFDSIDHIKKHDIELVEKELGRDMADPKSYTYVYDSTPILLRYIAENHIGCIGMIDVKFSFIDNTKEVKFLSAANPRFDFEVSSNSLETNVECIMRMPVYIDRDMRELSSHELKRLEPWY